MIGITPAFTLLCLASMCAAFEFDLIDRHHPKFFAPNTINDMLLNKAVGDEVGESEDNAGFERSQIFGGRSPSSTRRLLQEPPLKKRAVEHRLIREPPLKRSLSPIDLVYRFPYSVQKTSQFGSVIQPVDF